MNQNIRKLITEFKRIKEKGYIKGIGNNYASIGRTFENELKLSENTFCVPDYYGIEIKTRRAYSKSAITLFNAVPDGEELFEIERLKDTYGYPSKKDRKYKVLYIEAYGNKLNFAGIKYQYKIEVDRNLERVYLCVYDRFDRLIERKVYWSFDYLKERLTNKLQFLAIVNAWTNNIDGHNYFKYYKMDIYKLKSFDIFIDMIESGEIKTVLKIGIYLDNRRYGKTYDHGCGFAINEYSMVKLFYKLNVWFLVLNRFFCFFVFLVVVVKLAQVGFIFYIYLY